MHTILFLQPFVSWYRVSFVNPPNQLACWHGCKGLCTFSTVFNTNDVRPFGLKSLRWKDPCYPIWSINTTFAILHGRGISYLSQTADLICLNDDFVENCHYRFQFSIFATVITAHLWVQIPSAETENHIRRFPVSNFSLLHKLFA